MLTSEFPSSGGILKRQVGDVPIQLKMDILCEKASLTVNIETSKEGYSNVSRFPLSRMHFDIRL